MKSHIFIIAVALGLGLFPTSLWAAKACKVSIQDLAAIDPKSPTIDSIIRESRDEKIQRFDAAYRLKDGSTLEFSSGGCDEYWLMLNWGDLKSPIPQSQEQWLYLLSEKLKTAPLNQTGRSIFDRAALALEKMDRKKKLKADELGWLTFSDEKPWLCYGGWGVKKPGLEIQCKKSDL